MENNWRRKDEMWSRRLKNEIKTGRQQTRTKEVTLNEEGIQKNDI